MVCIYHFMYQYWLLDTLVFAFKKGKKLINETVFIRPLLYGIIDKKLAKETVFIKPLLYAVEHIMIYGDTYIVTIYFKIWH